MTTEDTLNDLRQRILAGYPILLLRTYEEQRWEDELASLAFEINRGLVTWSLAAGAQPPLSDDSSPGDAESFLKQVSEYPTDHLFLLKDLHPHLHQPEICRQLRELVSLLPKQNKTLLLMSPISDLPVELLKDITVLELPLPGLNEIRTLLHEVIAESSSQIDQIRPRDADRFAQAVLGLTLFEARNAFAQVLSHRDTAIDSLDTLLPQLVAEKRHLIQGSHLLEFFDLDESIDDIGGLDGLKGWVQQRAAAFSTEARTQGISNPRGVLLAGVQGCGKSLSAKAIARTLGFPLVRLDIGALLESTRGSSEQNLRDVLALMETLAPAVLWLEEIDKAFSGFDDESHQDATMSRLVGRFLVWLQEHTEPVFVVATANNVSTLPPEMLRRGRFDELFFVDLPNFDERLAIFQIHLAKRGWRADKFDVRQLAETTDGFSGAEIEQVVNSAIIEAHALQRMPTQADLTEARERTVPLSVTMEDEIFHLREWARTRCRPATLDHRVMQVMEAEQRRGELPPEQAAPRAKWMELVEHGQLSAAVVEYVRKHDHVTWPQLLDDLSAYTETAGEFGIVVRADPKVVLWIRISRDLADLFCNAIDGKRLFLHPVGEDVFPDESRPQLPALAALDADRQLQPAWLPTTLRLLPPVGGTGRLGHVARIRMGKPQKKEDKAP